MSQLGKLKPFLHRVLASELEGKCTVEGFVKPKTIVIESHSCGVLKDDTVTVAVEFTCDVANPVAGQVLECRVEQSTNAGLKCVMNETPSPFVVFVARDHHNTQETFATIQVNDVISIQVVGTRYEMHDAYIAVIGTLEAPSPSPPTRVGGSTIRTRIDGAPYSDATEALRLTNRAQLDHDIQEVVRSGGAVTADMGEEFKDTAPHTYKYLMRRVREIRGDDTDSSTDEED